MKKILVVSHERSGTHFLINSIAMNFGLDGRWIDVHCKDYIDPEDSYKRKYKNDIHKFFETNYNIDTNRIYKSHHQLGYYEEIIDDILENFDIFYIYRDGRDVLSSCYKYFNTAQSTAFPRCDTIEEFLFNTPPYLYPYDGAYSYIKSENMVQRWSTHIETWKPVFDKINVISYTKLQNQFNSIITNISTSLNRNLLGDPKRPLVNQNSINPGRGINGGWRDIMSEETANKIKEMIIK